MRVPAGAVDRGSSGLLVGERAAGGCRAKGVRIAHNVWVGGGVQINQGVSIGQNSIIGSGSVVTGDIPAYHIAGGNPCRVIRKRFDDALIEHLLKLRWWDWDAEKISDNLEALCSGDPGKIMEIGPEGGRT